MKAAAAAATEAINLLKTKDDPKQLGKAYILRAQLTEDEDRKLADFDAAAKADPSNSDAGQAMALFTSKGGQRESRRHAAEACWSKTLTIRICWPRWPRRSTDLKKYDDALKYCDGVIKQCGIAWATTCGPA